MGHKPYGIELDTRLRDCGEHYEHVALYVDDLLIASKDPQKIVDNLMKKHYFKLKGMCPIAYHIGCDFGRDEDGTLHLNLGNTSKRWKNTIISCLDQNPNKSSFHLWRRETNLS